MEERDWSLQNPYVLSNRFNVQFAQIYSDFLAKLRNHPNITVLSCNSLD